METGIDEFEGNEWVESNGGGIESEGGVNGWFLLWNKWGRRERGGRRGDNKTVRCEVILYCYGWVVRSKRGIKGGKGR